MKNKKKKLFGFVSMSYHSTDLKTYILDKIHIKRAGKRAKVFTFPQNEPLPENIYVRFGFLSDIDRPPSVSVCDFIESYLTGGANSSLTNIPEQSNHENIIYLVNAFLKAINETDKRDVLAALEIITSIIAEPVSNNQPIPKITAN